MKIKSTVNMDGALLALDYALPYRMVLETVFSLYQGGVKELRFLVVREGIRTHLATERLSENSEALVIGSGKGTHALEGLHLAVYRDHMILRFVDPGIAPIRIESRTSKSKPVHNDKIGGLVCNGARGHSLRKGRCWTHDFAALYNTLVQLVKKHKQTAPVHQVLAISAEDDTPFGVLARVLEAPQCYRAAPSYDSLAAFESAPRRGKGCQRLFDQSRLVAQ